MALRKCLGCAGEFHCPPSKNYSFCSMECKRSTRAQRFGAYCVRCGEVFVRRSGQARRRYCSSRCSDEGRAAATRASHSVPAESPAGAFWLLLSNGRSALVDETDRPAVTRYSWSECKGYPRATVRNRPVTLHIYLLGRRDGYMIDHIDRDRLNNRRCNLRFVPTTVNILNRGLQSNNTSGYRGVVRYGDGRWKAQAGFMGDMKYLGVFDTAMDAALAYDDFARREFGEYAVLNFPSAVAAGAVG